MAYATEETICNICNLPGIVKFQEKDEETGAYKTSSHKVGCLGHENVHPSLWNRSKLFDTYRRSLAQKRERCSLPPRHRTRGMIG